MTVPQKRKRQLVILSRDHHYGLLLCWKIRQGLNAGVASSRMRDYARHFYALELQPHFVLEEQFLFPLMEEGDPLRQKAEQEHQVLRGYFKDQEDVTSFQPKALVDTLEAHIRFEERVLFPYMESTIDPHSLQQAGDGLDKHHQVPIDRWPDPFWLKDK